MDDTLYDINDLFGFSIMLADGTIFEYRGWRPEQWPKWVTREIGGRCREYGR